MVLSQSRLKPLLTIVLLGLFVLGGWNIYSSMQTVRSTGILSVSVDRANATISISADGTEAQVIGTGSSKIRLKPGSYLIASNHDGSTANKIVTVRLGETTTTSLKLGEAFGVPSYKNIEFIGLDNILLNNSATTTQVKGLEQLFFRYDKALKKVVLDENSVELGPFSGDNPSTILYINGTTDDRPVKATVSYSGLYDISMALEDAVTTQVLFSDSYSEMGE